MTKPPENACVQLDRHDPERGPLLRLEDALLGALGYTAILYRSGDTWEVELNGAPNAGEAVRGRAWSAAVECAKTLGYPSVIAMCEAIAR